SSVRSNGISCPQEPETLKEGLPIGKTPQLLPVTHAVTTHWSALDALARRFPQARLQRDVRWVDERRLVTAAGISADIDMSLHLVERLAGHELAEEIAHYMEYRTLWSNDTRSVPHDELRVTPWQLPCPPT